MKRPEQRIRFHLDENVESAVAIGLRLRNIDVTTTNDAGLAGAAIKLNCRSQQSRDG